MLKRLLIIILSCICIADNVMATHLNMGGKTDTLSVDSSKILTTMQDGINIDKLFVDSLKKSTTIQDSVNLNNTEVDSTVINIRSSKYNDIEKATLIIDSLKTSGANLDIVSLDSLSRVYFTDTLYVKRGEIPIYNINGNANASFRLDSLLKEAIIERDRLERIRIKAARRSSTERLDTLSLTTTTLLSIPIPGFSQIYNKQYWKLPIIYGGVGGFVTGGFIIGKKQKETKSRLDALIAAEGHKDDIDRLTYDNMRYKNASTLMYVGAAVTYLYFLGDGIMNYDYNFNKTQKATLLAVILPGAGQIYNGQYWKLPILYGGFAALGYIISFNNKGYVRFKNAYDAMTDGNDNTVSEFENNYNPPSDKLIRNTRDSYRRYRDMAIFYTIGLYLVSIVDAYVDASLSTYDVSDDLTFRVEPMCELQNLKTAGGSRSPSGVAGITMKFTF